jgi:excisionase family DNA binding protein
MTKGLDFSVVDVSVVPAGLQPLPEDLEPLLTVQEVTNILRLSKKKVWMLLKSGALPCIRLPDCDRVMIQRSDLRTYLARGREQAKAK